MPSTRLMTESNVSPPYTQPRFVPIHAVTGVPANSASATATSNGAQHGLKMQAMTNITPLRSLRHNAEVTLPWGATLQQASSQLAVEATGQFSF